MGLTPPKKEDSYFEYGELHFAFSEERLSHIVQDHAKMLLFTSAAVGCQCLGGKHVLITYLGLG